METKHERKKHKDRKSIEKASTDWFGKEKNPGIQARYSSAYYGHGTTAAQTPATEKITYTVGMETEDQRVNDDQVYALLFGVRRSIRYHDRRRAWFTFWHRAAAAAGALFATSTMASILHQETMLAVVSSVAVTVLLVLDLVVGNADMANRHWDLIRRFSALEGDMVRAGESLSEAQYADFHARRLRIETDEPPVNRHVDQACHNDLLQALGHPEAPADIRWYRRGWLAHI